MSRLSRLAQQPVANPMGLIQKIIVALLILVSIFQLKMLKGLVIMRMDSHL